MPFPAGTAFPDVRPIPGSPGLIRVQAGRLRTLHDELETARRAAERLESITGGDVWSGPASEAFRAALDRRPVPADLRNAQSVMAAAASRLDEYAGRLDVAQRIVWSCRSRLAGLEAEVGVAPETQTDEVRRIAREIEQARGDEVAARRSLQTGFDLFDDQTVYATPPPSLAEQVGGFVSGAGGVLWDFGAGFVEGAWEMVEGVAKLAFYLNPLMLPFTAYQVWEHREEIVAIISYAVANPGAFAVEVGRVLIDWDTLTTDPARWLGKLAPEIIVTVLTAGAGRAATAAGRAQRIVRLADRSGATTRAVRAADLVVEVRGAGTTLDRARRARDLALPYLRGLALDVRDDPVRGARNILNDFPRATELGVDVASRGVLSTEGMGALGRFTPRAMAANLARDAVTGGLYHRAAVLDRWVNGLHELSRAEQALLATGTVLVLGADAEPLGVRLLDLAERIDGNRPPPSTRGILADHRCR